ncbi:hypothetical protein NQ318_001905 [Aromia moschata]|uniref:ODAD1 central coiled coil region domain-containing protein n=1 Tax=Aromia moschata TaxID=1265417 RepID=A0AAV8Z465_9CUCU|nr:hypothetical protein NQ318_001905 [Aromia moschata]
MEDDIRRQRPKSSVTEQDYHQRLATGQNAIRTLQGRLDNAVKKFCGILTENKILREDIDHLLKEIDLNLGKKYMADLIDQSTTAFVQREEWCSKLEALKKRAQNDFIAHSEEMREIQRQLDHDLTLREFLSVKGQRRILKDLEEKERRQKELEIQNLENQLRIYEETLEQIKKISEEEDIQRIASQFTKQEEENFALFNYVNELNHEIETFTATIADIQDKIEEQIELSQVRAQERQATLKSLENELEDAVKEADKEEENVRNAENVLNQVLTGIEALFCLLKCNRGPILDLLGENSAISLFNVKIYLGTIEKKVSAIINTVYFAEKAMMTKMKKMHKEDSVSTIQ